MILLIVLGVVVLCGLFVLSFYNGGIKLRNAIEEAFSTMDVYLKKRFDLIPNVVETVKGYATHEQETLMQVTEARTRVMESKTTEDRLENENAFQKAIGSLFAVAENYPDLKANTNFLALQQELSNVEEDIANSRKYYNAVVRQFNTKIEQFPGNMFAGMFRFFKQPLYAIPNEAERENVSVKF